ncbi:MAG: LytTR family DNA-binding domain-containing protein [Coriobacteriia bacterium]|nr:LytTR family DNA-binding domain-containing protein [Coriobacteriia bacterium]
MLRAMVVDDEAPARSELAYLLDEVGLAEVAAEASSVREAIEKLKDVHIDLIFLDVNMPEVNGMQFADALDKLKNPPAVVFVTAYSEYAADAFGVNAIDYLVKPVETERLKQALIKVNQHFSALHKLTSNERIPVEKNGKKILINTEKIHYVMAKDDYSYIFTEDDRYLSTISLAQLENRLGSQGFFRAHRRYLVNLAYVIEVEPVSGSTLLLTLRGEEDKIPVSRRRVSSIKKALGL